MERLTPRLRLSPIGPDDGDDLWFLHRDPGIARWFAGTGTREGARVQAADMGRQWREHGVHKWLARRRSDGALVGRGGCSWTELSGTPCLELGWALREEYWGNGYATEIGRAGLELAFEGLGADRVVSFTEAHNRRSRAVMERLGLSFVGTFVRPGLAEDSGEEVDHAVFALYEARA
ncbi:GNAT family N-acetyltransferase [Nocardiopsis oceani]